MIFILYKQKSSLKLVVYSGCLSSHVVLLLCYVAEAAEQQADFGESGCYGICYQSHHPARKPWAMHLGPQHLMEIISKGDGLVYTAF